MTASAIAPRFERCEPGPAQKIERRHEFFPSVLIVDDEPLIRWSVGESLSDLGFAVQTADDAASALRTVTTSRPFEVVVLDLRLPDMHDLSLLGTLRQLLPAARLILMTAYGSGNVMAEACAIGADVLCKPFDFDELHRLVTRHQEA